MIECPQQLRAGLRHPTRGDVDAIAKEVRPLNDHVALVHADAHFYRAHLRSLRVALAQTVLDTHSRLQCLNRTGELGQHPA
jgi:hypothetical protein